MMFNLNIPRGVFDTSSIMELFLYEDPAGWMTECKQFEFHLHVNSDNTLDGI